MKSANATVFSLVLLMSLGVVSNAFCQPSAPPQSEPPSADDDASKENKETPQKPTSAQAQDKSPDDESCQASFALGGEKTPPFGWKSAEAYHCSRVAEAAADRGDNKRCVTDAQAAIDLEPQFSTRATLARCLKASNQYYKAHSVETQLARDAFKAGQHRLAQAAQVRAGEIKQTMPALKIIVPDNVSELKVKFDERDFPPEDLGKGAYLDPGKHRILATGKVDNKPATFDQTIELEPGKPPVTIVLQLIADAPNWAKGRQGECLEKAKSAEEAAACVGGPAEDKGEVDVHVGGEVSVYHDDMDVDVISPVVSFGVENVLDGWGFGGAMLADVVTAASVDIAATASPHWREVRLAPEVHGHVKIDPVDISLAASLSHEPDYLATTLGGGLSVDMLQKNAILGVLYQYSHDINGRTETPFSVFSTLIDRHSATLSLTLVLNKSTLGVGAFNYVYEDGDASKPYRHVPMFAASVAPDIEPGLDIDSVNLARLPQRPLEQLPKSRMRFAGTVFVAHRFSASTLRVEERLYRDDWGTMATTTDMRFIVDLLDNLFVWPHLRFHAQDAADFYELAYVVEDSPSGPKIPALRTGDRELGPLLGGTLGAGVSWQLSDEVEATLSGDAIYTRFLNHLYVRDRLGAFGSLDVQVTF